MKVSYQREMRHNYLIIDPEALSWKSYECRMMEDNAIDGVLRFQLRQMDHEVRFYYEITSRQPLCRMLESRNLKAEEIRCLMIGIAGILDQMNRYLLRERIVMLDPEYIYVDPDTFRIWLCLVPGLEQNFPEDFGKLLEYLLGKVDHQDKECVILAYGLYQETRKENYGMEDILCLLHREAFRSESRRPQAEEKENAQEGEKKNSAGLLVNSFAESETESVGREYSPPAAVQVISAPESSGGRFCRLPKHAEEAASGSFWSWWSGIREKMRKMKGGRGGKTTERGRRAEPVPAVNRRPEEGEKTVSWSHAFMPDTEEDDADVKTVALSESDLAKTGILQTGPNTAILEDLTADRGDGSRILRSLSGKSEDIAISYFPFTIGKQENLADFVLNYNTVSRLHLRIDRSGEDYLIQDLNSTNGTVVSGRLLENNETARLLPGDEVWIANLHYRFE
ncbi:MAG: FHA domain-containing protein [Clostridiales bacterium]|nr:FHA domain-containing protein [Clostridiales bacterium]